MTTLSIEERTWVVIGVCLTKVLAPALRDVLAKEIPKWHQVLCQPPTEIDKQVFGKHQKKLPPSTWNLNYKNINNNDAIATPRAFDYAVKDPLSLAKLFVKPFMSRFTGFDKTMDISSVLSVICEAAPFLGAAAHAETVRSDVRNEWAHCIFTDWTKAKFKAAFQNMEILLKNMNLSPSDKQKLCDELKSWKIKGDQFCFGQPVDVEILTLLRGELDELREAVKTWKLEKEQMTTLLSSITDIKSNLGKQIDDLHMRVEKNSEDIKDLAKKFTNELSRISVKEEEKIPYVFNAPPRNRYFSGRIKEIQELKSVLEVGKTLNEKKVRVAAVCGLGGIGKTSLVAEYAHQMKGFYKGGIYWFSAENDAHLCKTVNAVAVRIGASLLNSFDLTLPNILKKIGTVNDPCLIVLDCLDQLDISSNVMEFLSFPSQENIFGHFIVVTRRNPKRLVNDVSVIEEEFCLQLKCLQSEEAKQFLFLRTKVTRDENENSESVAECLCEKLGRLPLALEQAGAYIQMLRCSLSSYAEEYDAEHLRLLKLQSARPISPGNEFSERLAVHTTWRINIEYIKKSTYGEAAVRFMNACFFFDINEVQKELVNVGAPEVDDVAYRKCVSSPLGCRHVLKLLTDFSLFTYVEPGCVSTHSLVQELVWDNLDPKSKTESLIDAVRMLFFAFSNCPSPSNHASLDKRNGEEQDISFSGLPNSPSHFFMWSKFCLHGHHLRSKVEKLLESPGNAWLDSVWSLETAKILYECAVHLSANHQQEEAKRNLNFTYRILDWLPLSGYETLAKNVSDDVYFPLPIPLPKLFQMMVQQFCIPTFTLLECLTEKPAPVFGNLAPDANDLAPATGHFATNASAFAPDPSGLVPDPSDFAPDLSDLAPNARDFAPDPSDLAPDARDLAPDLSDLAPDPSGLAPNAKDLAPDPSDLAPDARDLAPDLSDLAPDPSDLAPDPSGFAPDLSNLAPDPSDLASDPSGFAPDLSDLAPDARDLAPDLSDLASDPGGLAPDPSDFAPDLSDVAPDARDLAPDPSDVAPDARDLAPDLSDLASDPSGLAPNARNLAPDPSDLAPDARDLAPDLSDLAPDPSDLAPDSSGFAPDLSDLAPDPSDLAPDPSGFAPDLSDFAPDPSGLAPDLSDLAPDARDLAPDLSDLAPDPSSLAPDPSDFAPDLSDLAPDARDLAPDLSDLAPDARDFAPDPSDVAPDANDFAPDPGGLAPDARDFAPNLSDLAPDARDLAPDLSDLAPDARDFAPDPSVLAPDANDFASDPGCLGPDARDFAPDPSVLAPDANDFASDPGCLGPDARDFAPDSSDVAPDANDFAPVASNLFPNANDFAPDATDSAPDPINFDFALEVSDVDLDRKIDKFELIGNYAYSSGIILAQDFNQLFDFLLLTKRSMVYIKLEQWKSALKNANDYITRRPYCWRGYALKALALDGLNKEVSAELKENTSAEIAAALAFYYNRAIFTDFSIFVESFPDLQSRIFICDSVIELLDAMFLQQVGTGLMKVLVLGSKEYILNSDFVAKPWNNCILVGTRNNCSVSLKSSCDISLLKCMLTNLSFSFSHFHCLPDSFVKILNCNFSSDDAADGTIKTEGVFNAEQCNFTRSLLVCGKQSYAVVRGCSFCNNLNEGLCLEECETFRMEKSRIYNNGGKGLVVETTTECVVVNCDIHDNGDDGINIYKSESVTLIDNNVSSNKRSGICVVRSFVSFRENNLFGNGTWGIWADSLMHSNVSTNKILRNKVGGVRMYFEFDGKTVSSVQELNKICYNNGPGVMVNNEVVNSAECQNNEMHYKKEGENDGKTNLSMPYCSCCRVKRNLTMCEKCFTTAYCSESCQRQHYLKHKVICKVLREKSSYLIISTRKASHREIKEVEFSKNVGLRFSAPPPRDGRMFVVKVHTAIRESDSYAVIVHDRSLDHCVRFASKFVDQLLKEFGLLCERNVHEKKLFFHCLFEDNGQLRLFTNDFAEFQDW